MDEQHTKILKINHKYLVQNLQVVDILDFVVSRGIINDEEREELETERTSFKAARKFLRILPKKGPKAYGIFLEALEDSGSYFIVEELQNSDLSKFEDVPDAFDQEDKFAQFQQQLFLQTELLKQYKEDKDRLEKRVRENELETSELRSKYGDIENIIQVRGISTSDAAEYLNDYLNEKDIPDLAFHLPVSPLPSPSKSSIGSSRSFEFSLEDIRANSESLCEAIARDVGKDLVCFVIQTTFKRRTSKPSSKYAATMRRVANEVISRHEGELTSFIAKLQMDQINGYDTLITVANKMFAEGDINWGRIAALYAFAGLVASSAAENNNENMATFMGDFLGFYVGKKLGDWINEQGGWVCSVYLLINRNF